MLLDRIGKRRWLNSVLRGRRHNQNSLEQKGRDRADFFYIKAPEIIEIYDAEGQANHFLETMVFLNKIRTGFLKDNAVLDFRKTKHVSAAALIMLYAEIENCKRQKRARILYPKEQEKVKKSLQLTNIHKLVKASPISYEHLDEMEHIPIVSSKGADFQEEIIDHIQKRIYSDKLSPELEHKYGDAVSETIYNVQMHAYLDDGAEDKWWLLCSVVEDRLYLAIYDLGVGIPNTVVKRSRFKDVISKLLPSVYLKDVGQMTKQDLGRAGVTEAKLIDISMQGDVSGTREAKHGQGSKSIKALVESFSDGKLHIFSGKGLFKMSGEDCKVELFDLSAPVKGTLIQWSMDLR